MCFLYIFAILNIFRHGRNPLIQDPSPLWRARILIFSRFCYLLAPWPTNITTSRLFQNIWLIRAYCQAMRSCVRTGVSRSPGLLPAMRSPFPKTTKGADHLHLFCVVLRSLRRIGRSSLPRGRAPVIPSRSACCYANLPESPRPCRNSLFGRRGTWRDPRPAYRRSASMQWRGILRCNT